MNTSGSALNMNQALKQWEGQVVNYKFPLQKYLGSSDHSIVFLTEREEPRARRAAIKLMSDIAECRESRLALWAQAATLHHPNLLQIFEAGRCQIGEVALLYVVMECADEDLSEVTNHRHLSFVEARELLQPLLSALEYLHGEGFIHGSLKPSNVMAIGDQIKLSADALHKLGELQPGEDRFRATRASAAPEMASGPTTPASDVWSLGAMLEEVLPLNRPRGDKSSGADSEPATLAVPGEIPSLFADIVSHSLQQDPEQRWTISEITERLQRFPQTSNRPEDGSGSERNQPAVASPERKSLGRWTSVPLAVAGVILVLFFVVSKLRRSELSHAPKQSESPSEVRQNPSAVPEPALSKPKAKPAPAGSSRSQSSTSVGSAAKPTERQTTAGVRQQVLPDVSASARRTITGHVRVAVKVNVDNLGNVANASFQTRGPSEYFARIALEAAQHWKFVPAQANGENVASQWVLRFAFGRQDTEVQPTQVAP
jgi:TonB family protein